MGSSKPMSSANWMQWVTAKKGREHEVEREMFLERPGSFNEEDWGWIGVIYAYMKFLNK